MATHIGGLLEFHTGAIAAIIMSFDIWAANLPRIEIYGTEGTVSAPDPNSFGGPVRLRKGTDPEWMEIPMIDGYAQGNSRGIGVVDMAQALQSGRPHRASGELAYHVLDIMYGLLNSSTESRYVEIASTCERPSPMAEKLA